MTVDEPGIFKEKEVFGMEPLDGVRVPDLSRFQACPQATIMKK